MLRDAAEEDDEEEEDKLEAFAAEAPELLRLCAAEAEAPSQSKGLANGLAALKEAAADAAAACALPAMPSGGLSIVAAAAAAAE